MQGRLSSKTTGADSPYNSGPPLLSEMGVKFLNIDKPLVNPGAFWRNLLIRYIYEFIAILVKKSVMLTGWKTVKQKVDSWV